MVDQSSATNPASRAKTEGAISDGPGYGAALQLAEQAFDLIGTYQTPPIPRVYEICYSYVSGKPRALRERVDAAVEQDGVLSLHEVYEIHNDLFSYPDALRALHDQSHADLDDELSNVMETVTNHLESNQEYTASLDQASDQLNGKISQTMLRKTISFLMKENEKARIEAEKLSDSLEASQHSIQVMRDKLEQAKEAGLRDALTSLRNRRYFDTALPTQIEEARRTGTSLCLTMVDIDHFKRINDNFGHPAGDAVLRVVGKLLADNVKGRDTPVRYGGEEFSIILPRTEAVGAANLSNKIRKELESKNLVLTESRVKIGRVTASFGVAELRDDDTGESLMARADEMLYAAKNGGRNRVVTDAD